MNFNINENDVPAKRYGGFRPKSGLNSLTGSPDTLKFWIKETQGIASCRFGLTLGDFGLLQHR